MKIAHASCQIVGQNCEAENGEAGWNETAKEGWNAASVDSPDAFSDEAGVGDDECAADENDLQRTPVQLREPLKSWSDSESKKICQKFSKLSKIVKSQKSSKFSNIAKIAKTVKNCQDRKICQNCQKLPKL